MMGDELRKLREQAGFTQEQLSFRADLSRPYISQLEQDHKSPTVDTLFRICDALDASAADLVRRVDAARKRKPARCTLSAALLRPGDDRTRRQLRPGNRSGP